MIIKQEGIYGTGSVTVGSKTVNIRVKTQDISETLVPSGFCVSIGELTSIDNFDTFDEAVAAAMIWFDALYMMEDICNG